MPKVKKVIKGVAKTTGKYTLKGATKAAELVLRGGVKTVHALVKSPMIQSITSNAGLLATSVLVPAVGVPLISLVGIKYLTDNAILGKNRDILDEAMDIWKGNYRCYSHVMNNYLAPVIEKGDDGLKKIGGKLQDSIDKIFI